MIKLKSACILRDTAPKMEAITIEKLQALAGDLRPVCESHASQEHFDGHNYKFKGVELKPVRPGSTYPAHVTIHLESIYADGFKDKLAFNYAIHSTGGIGRIRPRAPLSQQQVFDAYDTWGFAVERWIGLVKTHFDPKARKARWASVYEELAAKMWHPDRLAALLERGGWEAVEGVA